MRSIKHFWDVYSAPLKERSVQRITVKKKKKEKKKKKQINE